MKKKLLPVLLLIASIFLTLALVEIALSYIKPSGGFTEWNANSLSYLLDEEVDWKLEPKTFPLGKINRYNFRGEEIGPGAGMKVCRIVVTGGSAAFDLWKADNATWSARLESKLSRAMPAKVQVINTGTPGYSSLQAFKLVKSKMIRWKPDLVLLYELFNDSMYFRISKREEIIRGWKLNAHASYIGFFAHPHPVFDFLSICLPRTIDIARMYGVKMQKVFTSGKNDSFWQNPRRDSKISETGLSFYEENRRGLAWFLHRNNIRLGIVSQASLIKEKNDAKEQYQIAYRYRGFNHEELWRAYQRAREIDRKIAEEEPNAFLIEAHKMIPSSFSYLADEVHLNAAGSELLADIIANELLRRQNNPETRWCKTSITNP